MIPAVKCCALLQLRPGQQVLLRQNERRREATLMQVASGRVSNIANLHGGLTPSCDAALTADRIVCRARPVFIQCVSIQILLMRVTCSRNKLQSYLEMSKQLTRCTMIQKGEFVHSRTKVTIAPANIRRASNDASSIEWNRRRTQARSPQREQWVIMIKQSWKLLDNLIQTTRPQHQLHADTLGSSSKSWRFYKPWPNTTWKHVVKTYTN